MNRNARFNIRTLEDNLQTMLENVLQNYLNPGQALNPVPGQAPNASLGQGQSNIPNPPHAPNPVPMPNINNRNQTYVDEMAILHTVRELTQGYTSNIREYNNNMREYNSNITTALSLMRLFYQRQTNENIDRISTEPRTPLQTPAQGPVPLPTQAPLHTQAYTHQRHARTPILTFTMFPHTDAARTPLYENVIVSPTYNEVEEATERLSYSPDMMLINTQCPIALEDFVEDESLVRIRHCGHTFREASIYNWFRSNVRCPVCRHDIRTGPSQEDNINTESDYNESNAVVNEYLRDFGLDASNNELDNELDNDADNDAEQDIDHDELEFIAEITTTYEFPIPEDSSNNTMT